ncbi:MAG: DUF1538 domain-containing protein [Clostridia bacterium]|nr:DUF1538 domain-containing protein [Clostridia bacterium]
MTFFKKIKESVLAVLPIMVIVIVLNFVIKPMDNNNLYSFLIGSALVIFGIALYSFGVDKSIEPAGKQIGTAITKIKIPFFICLIIFVIGVIITMAEPDLSVLASEISMNKYLLIISISIGIGLFMVLSILRIFFKISLKIVLIIFYLLTFLLIVFSDANIIPFAFDAGGVTTGPITVPFILAISISLGTILGSDDSQDNLFGMIGICSIGPIMIFMILMFATKSNVTPETFTELTKFNDFGQILMTYIKTLPEYIKQVGIALGPITLFYIIMNFFSIRIPFKRFLSILIGFLYTFIGLTLFLLGVNVGFMQTGSYIGFEIAKFNKFLTIPISAVVGACIVLAEPAIRVLAKQVEQITNGTIKKGTIIICLIVSMMLAASISLLRSVTGISILYFLIPGYVISLALSFVVPKLFTGIAFDSGGVASGPMTATFLLPFACGACSAVGGNVMSDAFGTVAMVAMMPLLTLQLLGLVFKLKSRSIKVKLDEETLELLKHEGEIIEF